MGAYSNVVLLASISYPAYCFDVLGIFSTSVGPESESQSQIRRTHVDAIEARCSGNFLHLFETFSGLDLNDAQHLVSKVLRLS